MLYTSRQKNRIEMEPLSDLFAVSTFEAIGQSKANRRVTRSLAGILLTGGSEGALTPAEKFKFYCVVPIVV